MSDTTSELITTAMHKVYMEVEMEDETLVERVEEELVGVLCREAFGMEGSIARAILMTVADAVEEHCELFSPPELWGCGEVVDYLREQAAEEGADAD